MKKLWNHIRSLGNEWTAAIIAILLFSVAAIPIMFFSPTAITADVGGELHMMMKGVVVGLVSLALTALTHFIGLKTHYIYAILSGDSKDPEDKLASYREDFREADTAAKRFRATLFTATFFLVWIIWIYVLTPDAVVVQALAQ